MTHPLSWRRCSQRCRVAVVLPGAFVRSFVRSLFSLARSRSLPRSFSLVLSSAAGVLLLLPPNPFASLSLFRSPCSFPPLAPAFALFPFHPRPVSTLRIYTERGCERASGRERERERARKAGFKIIMARAILITVALRYLPSLSPFASPHLSLALSLFLSVGLQSLIFHS